MSANIRRLPDAELEVMLIVWEAQPPVMAGYVLERLQGKRQWSLQTLLTVMARLVEKGFLACEKQGRNNQYTPLIPESEYKQAEGKSILERLYDNSFKDLVVNLFDAKAINKKDLAELRGYLDELEGK